jgi:hypothetical protein
MNGATIYLDPRDDMLVYSERWKQTIRSTSLHYKSVGFGITFFGFSIGWKKISLFTDTMVRWNYGDREEPISREDRERVLQQARALLIGYGYIVKFRQ